MKRYIKSSREIPVGTKVFIKSPDHFENGGWGVVKYFDGDDYHVAMYGGEDNQLLFSRNELIVPRDQSRIG